MPFAQLTPSFNAGELSPYMAARSDIEKYASGLQICENFIPMTYGGLQRRPGTEYLGRAKHADKLSLLIGFNFSTTTSFILEMGELYFRFWSNGARIPDPGAPANPLEVVSPYLEDELLEVQYLQINDIMYFVHPNHPVYKMTRAADDDWTFAEMVPDWPALLDENTEDTTITPSGTSGSVTLTASANLFSADMVGSYIQLGQTRAAAFVDKLITATGTSTAITVLGDWEFNTYETWSATVVIERSYDGTNWETIRSYRSVADFNAASDGTETKECQLRINVTAYTSGTGRAVLSVAESRDYGVAKITSYNSPILVNATVTNNFLSTAATKYWSEGAWSVKRGFPRSVTLHEQRIWFGGTKYKPLSLWGSVIDDFQNFRVSSNDDSGLYFTLSAPESNPIQWLTSQDQLLIGTAGNEWTLGSSDQASAITPTNVRAVLRSSHGSKYIRALVINDVILFVQRQGRNVREFVYVNGADKQGYVAPNLTILSEHITNGGIQQVAYQQQPDAIYWAVTGNGELIGMTYEREQNVVAWHRHTTGKRIEDGVEVQDDFESVATIYGGSGPDEVWVTVRRKIDGADVRYIERFDVEYRQAFEESDKAAWWYLDCATRSINAPKIQTVTDLDHLEGREVNILADGAVSPERTVADGEITLQAEQANILVGLPYPSTMEPMFFEIAADSGSTVGNKKRIPKAIIWMRNSLAGEYSANRTASSPQWDKIYSRQMSDVMDSSAAVMSGPSEQIVCGDSFRAASLAVRQVLPLPLTLLAINTHWDVAGT